MTDLEDALDDYNLDPDRPMCGRITKTGSPCQRTRNSILGDCPRHNPLTEATRALPRMFDQFADTTVAIVAQAAPAARQLKTIHRKHEIRERYIEYDPATQPPALPEGR